MYQQSYWILFQYLVDFTYHIKGDKNGTSN